MSRSRSFDWDEARRLRAKGLTYVEIGERLGVSNTTAMRACDPGYRERQYKNSRRLIEAKRQPCLGGCGRLTYAHYGASHEPSGYCPACHGALRKVVRHGTESEYSQGCRCNDCRSAATEARRRRRQKVAA